MYGMNKGNELLALESGIKRECKERKCNERNCHLCDNDVNVVFGKGNPHARLVFVGEAPGKDENEAEMPFVGRAGKELHRIINEMKIDWEKDAYICNVIKCRPVDGSSKINIVGFSLLPFERKLASLMR